MGGDDANRPHRAGFSRQGGVTTLMLPGDPTYPLPEGLEPIEETRFELADGAWRPVCTASDPMSRRGRSSAPVVAGSARPSFA